VLYICSKNVRIKKKKIFKVIYSWYAGAELGGCQGGPLPSQNFAWPPSGPPKIFQISFWKSYADHWQLPLLQNWPLQWPPQMKMSGSAPGGICRLTHSTVLWFLQVQMNVLSIVCSVVYGRNSPYSDSTVHLYVSSLKLSLWWKKSSGFLQFFLLESSA